VSLPPNVAISLRRDEPYWLHIESRKNAPPIEHFMARQSFGIAEGIFVKGPFARLVAAVRDGYFWLIRLYLAKFSFSDSAHS
jgi:hypothetical protein